MVHGKACPLVQDESGTNNSSSKPRDTSKPIGHCLFNPSPSLLTSMEPKFHRSQILNNKTMGTMPHVSPRRQSPKSRCGSPAKTGNAAPSNKSLPVTRSLENDLVPITPTKSTHRKPTTPQTKSPPVLVLSPRRSLAPPSHPLYIKVLLTRLLPPEIVLIILSLASMYHRTTFIRTRQPTSYRERQICTPHRIYQSVPPTLHLLSSPHAVCGVGTHPLRSVKFYLRFCPAKLPNARVNFEARLSRNGKAIQGSGVPLIKSICMDGKLHSISVEIREDRELVQVAKAGDQIGVWVSADGGLYGDWLHIPGHEMRVLVEVREVSIECFCEW